MLSTFCRHHSSRNANKFKTQTVSEPPQALMNLHDPIFVVVVVSRVDYRCKAFASAYTTHSFESRKHRKCRNRSSFKKQLLLHSPVAPCHEFRCSFIKFSIVTIGKQKTRCSAVVGCSFATRTKGDWVLVKCSLSTTGSLCTRQMRYLRSLPVAG